MCAVSSFTERHSEPKQFGCVSPTRRRYNSLPVKILPVSYLQSRFWRPVQPLGVGNFNKTQQLSDRVLRADIAQLAANSFICKILRVSSMESRFCSANNLSRRIKLFVIKILSHQDKKRVTPVSFASLSTFSLADVPVLIERGIVN